MGVGLRMRKHMLIRSLHFLVQGFGVTVNKAGLILESRTV